VSDDDYWPAEPFLGIGSTHPLRARREKEQKRTDRLCTFPRQPESQIQTRAEASSQAEIQKAQAMRLTAELTASFLILASMWCAADKSLLAPWLGMLGCIILVALFIQQQQWGLLPMEIFAIALYCRQALRWRNARVSR
jgi:F0F1-type ATP synthase assembly protein I